MLWSWMFLLGLRACHWAGVLVWKIFRLYKKESNSSVSGICMAICWVLPAVVRECFWSKWQKGKLYWDKFTVIFNSILAHWYVKFLICFCFLFTIQEQTSPWWITETYFPPIHGEKYFPIQEASFEKVKIWNGKRDTEVKERPLCVVKRSWEDFLSSLGGKTGKLRTKQALSEITKLRSLPVPRPCH